jgi:hypothetical protein
MTIIKIKNLVEFSFHKWISKGYPFDSKSFYIFVKTVCKYHATKWKNSNYLEKRILEKMPALADDQEYLDNQLILFEHLIEFHKAIPLKDWDPIPHKYCRQVKSGYYIEQWIKDGKIQERELPLPKLGGGVLGADGKAHPLSEKNMGHSV